MNRSDHLTPRRSLSDFLLLPVNVVMTVIDLPLSLLQRVIGVQRMAYFFLLPNMLIFAIFILLPMLLNFYYGFTSGSSILLENREFVGTDNLEEILSCENYLDVGTCKEDYFWQGLRNTVFYVNAQVISMVILALLTAVSLNRKIAFRGFFRSVFFYPVLLSPVVVGLIWRWLLRLDGGLINAVMADLGYDRIDFLTEPHWARFWVIVVSDWAQMGFYTLILLAGLQAIPPDLYEAATMDGANEWNRFRFITFPLLLPTLTVVVVLALIRAVQVFDQVFVLTGGGPGTATTYMVQYIYRNGFGISPPNFGMAAAASLVLAVMLLIMTLGQVILARRREAV